MLRDCYDAWSFVNACVKLGMFTFTVDAMTWKFWKAESGNFWFLRFTDPSDIRMNDCCDTKMSVNGQSDNRFFISDWHSLPFCRSSSFSRRSSLSVLDWLSTWHEFLCPRQWREQEEGATDEMFNKWNSSWNRIHAVFIGRNCQAVITCPSRSCRLFGNDHVAAERVPVNIEHFWFFCWHSK